MRGLDAPCQFSEFEDFDVGTKWSARNRPRPGNKDPDREPYVPRHRHYHLRRHAGRPCAPRTIPQNGAPRPYIRFACLVVANLRGEEFQYAPGCLRRRREQRHLKHWPGGQGRGPARLFTIPAMGLSEPRRGRPSLSYFWTPISLPN
jgi:hypothetical protein